MYRISFYWAMTQTSRSANFESWYLDWLWTDEVGPEVFSFSTLNDHSSPSEAFEQPNQFPFVFEAVAGKPVQFELDAGARIRHYRNVALRVVEIDGYAAGRCDLIVVPSVEEMLDLKAITQ